MIGWDRKIEGTRSWIKEKVSRTDKKSTGNSDRLLVCLEEEQSEQQGAFRQTRLSLWWSSSGDTVQPRQRADSEGVSCWGLTILDGGLLSPGLQLLWMFQQIIRVFDDPSCPLHLCTQTAHLLASTNGQRNHISP